MNEKTPLKGGNPGFAGELGEYGQLTEADVRGSNFVGERPLAGGIGGGDEEGNAEVAGGDRKMAAVVDLHEHLVRADRVSRF